jgi:CheY-like chemotaxis protein
LTDERSVSTVGKPHISFFIKGNIGVPKKILIVEDQSDALDMLALLFRHEGYQVITATDGQQGFDSACKEQPDLILTDLMMPNLDGIDMIHLLRNEPQFQKVPIIVMTAYGEIKAQKALDAGANEAVHKPIPFDHLINLTAQLISTYR